MTCFAYLFMAVQQCTCNSSSSSSCAATFNEWWNMLYCLIYTEPFYWRLADFVFVCDNNFYEILQFYIDSLLKCLANWICIQIKASWMKWSHRIYPVQQSAIRAHTIEFTVCMHRAQCISHITWNSKSRASVVRSRVRSRDTTSSNYSSDFECVCAAKRCTLAHNIVDVMRQLYGT